MEPNSRLTCKELLEHGYFEGFRENFEAELQVNLKSVHFLLSWLYSVEIVPFNYEQDSCSIFEFSVEGGVLWKLVTTTENESALELRNIVSY